MHWLKVIDAPFINCLHQFELIEAYLHGTNEAFPYYHCEKCGCSISIIDYLILVKEKYITPKNLDAELKEQFEKEYNRLTGLHNISVCPVEFA